MKTYTFMIAHCYWSLTARKMFSLWGTNWESRNGWWSENNVQAWL